MTWAVLAYGMCVGLWLLISSLPLRRLVLNHTRGMYHFSIQGRTVYQGPMHLVYVRLALNSDGDLFGESVGGRERTDCRGLALEPSPEGPVPSGGPILPQGSALEVPPSGSALSGGWLSCPTLASQRKALLSTGPLRPQAGAAGTGSAVRALRGG